MNDCTTIHAAGALVSLPGAYTVLLSTGAARAPEIAVPLTLTGARRVLETVPDGIRLDWQRFGACLNSSAYCPDLAP